MDILVALHKTAVSRMRLQWRYLSLAQSRQQNDILQSLDLLRGKMFGTRCDEILESLNVTLELLSGCEIWEAPQQQSFGGACQITEW